MAALVFVVHPLASEVTNYVRARDHELIGLFSFLAAGSVARAMRGGGWPWLAAAILAVLAATFSKGPGLPHALLSCAIVATAFFNREQWHRFRSNRAAIFAMSGAAALTFALVFARLTHLLSIFVEQLPTRLFLLNALNQSRVLWEYLWRMVLPMKLCSDHLILSTRDFQDVGAWIAAAGVVALIAGVILLWRKRLQPWALLTTLALAPLLLRWLYVVSELMVEYRTYPSMPFVSILIALAIWHWHRHQPRIAFNAAAIILFLFIAQSHARSRDWRSSETLHAQILRFYPLQLRALNGLADNDRHEGHYEDVLKREPEFLKRFNEVIVFNASHPHRNYHYWLPLAIEADCILNEAGAHARSASIALMNQDMVAWKMNQSQIVHAGLWGEWHFTAGKIAFLVGDRAQALRHFLAARSTYLRKLPVDREIQKILPAYRPETIDPSG